MSKYARLHGSSFAVAERVQCNRPPAWSKLVAIANAFLDSDVVLWLDADVFIKDFDRNIFEEFEESCVTAMAEHPNPPHLNTGVWLLRREMIPRLVEAAMEDEFINHSWWEQAAVHRVLERHKDRVCGLGLEWNSFPGCLHESPVFLHACGLHGHGEQLRQILEWDSQ
jgi:hypothetical protein